MSRDRNSINVFEMGLMYSIFEHYQIFQLVFVLLKFKLVYQHMKSTLSVSKILKSENEKSFKINTITKQ